MEFLCLKNWNLNKERKKVIVDFDKKGVTNLDVYDDNYNIVNSCIEIASKSKNLLQNENSCKELINLLNDGKSEGELASLSKEEFQIHERRNWIFLQLLCEYAIHERKNLNELLNFSYIKENYVMQAIIRQNQFGCLDSNKYTGTKAVSTIWFLYNIQKLMKEDKDNYITIFNTKREIPNHVCGDLLFEYLEENNQTNNFIKNFSLNFNKMEDEIKSSETNDIENNIIFLHDVNEFIKFMENKNRFLYKFLYRFLYRLLYELFESKNFSFGETVVLQEIFNKCCFWNRRRILRNAMQNNLSDIYDFASRLPSNRRDEFFVWVRNNRGNFDIELAQNAGFFSREQEELLQLVPHEYRDRFRELFRNKNFRKVCQTISPIEYINECLKNGAKIEDIRIALDTFDINKIYDFFEDKFDEYSQNNGKEDFDFFGDEFEWNPENFKKPYLFFCIDNWICYVRDIKTIENSKFDESAKKTFLNNCQIAFNLAYRDKIILELNGDENGLLIANMGKLLSIYTIEDYKNRFADKKIVGADDYEPAARDYLGFPKEVIAPFSGFYTVLIEVKFENYKLCDIRLKLNIIADNFFFAEKNNDFSLLSNIISFLNKPEAKNLKIEFMKIVSEQKKHFITEAFENNEIGLNEFEKLIKGTVVDVLCLINFKEDVYEVYEFLKLGFDISKVNFADSYKIISLTENIDNETDKKLLHKEFINIAPIYKDNKGIIKNTILLAEELKDENDEKQIYDCLYTKISALKKIIQKNPKFVAKIFLLNLKPEKVAIIFIKIEKIISENEYFEFLDAFKCHLGANQKVVEALTTEENIPKLEAVFESQRVQ